MEIKVSEKVIETIYYSLTASKHSLRSQLAKEINESKKEILRHQLNEVEEALVLFNI